VWMFMYPDLIATNGAKAYGLDLVSRGVMVALICTIDPRINDLG
jgi:hypothetical protein